MLCPFSVCLQLDIGPFQVNLTDANTSVLPGGGSESDVPERWVEPAEGGPWTLEDLEGELHKKVELLEKERKGLRLETQRHRNDIDQGIDKLHHRIAGLEDGKLEEEIMGWMDGDIYCTVGYRGLRET